MPRWNTLERILRCQLTLHLPTCFWCKVWANGATKIHLWQSWWKFYGLKSHRLAFWFLFHLPMSPGQRARIASRCSYIPEICPEFSLHSCEIVKSSPSLEVDISPYDQRWSFKTLPVPNQGHFHSTKFLQSQFFKHMNLETDISSFHWWIHVIIRNQT